MFIIDNRALFHYMIEKIFLVWYHSGKAAGAAPAASGRKKTGRK